MFSLLADFWKPANIMLMAALIVGTIIGFAVSEVVQLEPFHLEVWGNVSDWVMIIVTIILTFFAATLPHRLQKQGAAAAENRYVNAVLYSYKDTFELIAKWRGDLHAREEVFFEDKNTLLSDLYEETRSSATHYGAFLDLEILRTKILIFGGKMEEAPRAPNGKEIVEGKPWKGHHKNTFDQTYIERCTELAMELDSFLNVINEIRSSYVNR